MTAPSGTDVFAAWQGALAAEQQAVFGYGLVGAHLAGTPSAALVMRCAADHAAQVDAVSAAMVAAGQTPVAPHADYPSLYPVTTAAQAQNLAVRLESDCATAWRYLYAATVAMTASASAASLRTTAQTQLTASAVRAVQWRKSAGSANPTVPFPGI